MELTFLGGDQDRLPGLDRPRTRMIVIKDQETDTKQTRHYQALMVLFYSPRCTEKNII
jgi:hypothetical protein